MQLDRKSAQVKSVRVATRIGQVVWGQKVPRKILEDVLEQSPAAHRRSAV
jgi:hypothetical protein